MFCSALSEVNYSSVIIFIDEDIVCLHITSYYLNIVKFLDDVFNLTCLFLSLRKCDNVNVNQIKSQSFWIQCDVSQENSENTVIFWLDNFTEPWYSQEKGWAWQSIFIEDSKTLSW